MKIVRYRVRKASGHYLIVDTMTKAVTAHHTDATEAHMHAGTLNYQHRKHSMALAYQRRHKLHRGNTQKEPR